MINYKKEANAIINYSTVLAVNFITKYRFTKVRNPLIRAIACEMYLNYYNNYSPVINDIPRPKNNQNLYAHRRYIEKYQTTRKQEEGYLTFIEELKEELDL